jgi:hypothetical protein
MNKIILFSLLFLICFKQNSIAQTKIKHEVGAFAGTSYYMGEINPANQFYAPSPAGGVIYKLLIDKRSALGAHVYYGQFRGSDSDFNNQYQQNRNASFAASLLDINAFYEFNFLPFNFNARKRVFSPFLFVGLGYEIKLQSQSNIGNHFAVPFGMGVKYLASRKVTVGAEWSFRKTFRDNIDGLENPGESMYKSSISNTDWYSFAGIFITFRLFDHSGDCPAYQ